MTPDELRETMRTAACAARLGDWEGALYWYHVAYVRLGTVANHEYRKAPFFLDRYFEWLKHHATVRDRIQDEVTKAWKDQQKRKR